MRILLLATIFTGLPLAQPPGGPGGASGDGIWRRNAYFGEAQTFDYCLGHQPGNGQYHYHAQPVCIRASLNDNVTAVRATRTGTVFAENSSGFTHSPILGWALDGYPIYGPYGYSDTTTATSAVKRMTSSYRLRNITARTSLPDWTLPSHTTVSQQLTANQYGPTINSVFPLGRYIEDFEYVQGLGDLDQYNGRFAITPDYPQGTYAYYVTVDAKGVPVFPYILAGQYYGAPTGGSVQTVPATALDFFNNHAYTQSTAATPGMSSWTTKGSAQNAQVVSGFDPSAGPKTTWPGTVPAGVTTSGSVNAPALADIQRIRYSDNFVYVNGTGLASYVMGPWFDPQMVTGVFANFPNAQNLLFEIPRTTAAATTRTPTGLGPVGLWVNGVAVFNFLDGGSYSNSAGADQGGGIVSQTASQLNAATYENGPVAAGSLISAFPLFGAALATSTAAAATPVWPTTLGGATVSVTDSTGAVRQAEISYASAGQINYRLPPATAAGSAKVVISGASTTTSYINVTATYPGLFTLNSTSLAAAYTTRSVNGQQVTTQVYQTSGANVVAAPVAVGTGDVYLILFGTGLGSGTSATATVGGVSAPVTYGGPQGTYNGLDQYNILIPASLASKGQVDVVVTAGGKVSNTVNITVQ